MRGLAALAWRSLPSLQAQRSNPYRGMEKAGLLRFARNDVEGFEFQTARRPHSRGMICPSCTISFRPKREGAGNAGCLLHPRSRVQDALKNAHTSIQVQTEHSGVPCAMALRLMPRSPRRRIRLATVAVALAADAAFPRSGKRRPKPYGCNDHRNGIYAALSAANQQMTDQRASAWRSKFCEGD